MDPLRGIWRHIEDLGHITYTCGYCGGVTAIKYGYYLDGGLGSIYICGGCNRPTFREDQYKQTPAPILGNEVTHLPEAIDSLYQEARHCTQVESYTACVLVCRKLLMHIAVEKEADENLKFIQYVNYLVDEHYAPPGSKGWVDHIRDKGNEANHEIVLMSKDEAFRLLSFVELLLKYVYEMPARIMPSNDNQSD